MFNVLDLSWYILRKCAEKGTPISNLQLQKMLYFLQKTNLEKIGVPLFSEKIRAWKFGPVVREVYYTFSAYSSLRIIPTEYNPNPQNIDLDDFLLNEVEERARKKPWELVDETHKPGKAWDIIYKNGKGNDSIIPLELIKTNG